METNWISSAGSFIRDFEARFAEACGTSYGVACANGTVAMHLALATLGLEPGDEVIIPTFTMIATANAVTYCGATPVLVDMSQTTGRWISTRWREDHAAHQGHRAGAHLRPSRRHGPADGVASGTAHRDRRFRRGARRRIQGPARSVGWETPPALAFTATRSSPPAKAAWSQPTIVTWPVWPGICATTPLAPKRHFWHKFVGFNYRMTNLQAAVGLAQVEQLDKFVVARRRNAAEYTRRLDGIPGITTPPQAPWAKNVYWMYGILVDAQTYGMNRDGLRKVLADHGIETRTFFIPMHCQPVYCRNSSGPTLPGG